MSDKPNSRSLNNLDFIQAWQHDQQTRMFSETKMPPGYYELALAGEVGELCNAVKKAIRGDEKALESLHDKVKEEAADILVYLLVVASEHQINLADAYWAKQEVIRKRLETGYYGHAKKG